MVESRRDFLHRLWLGGAWLATTCVAPLSCRWSEAGRSSNEEKRAELPPGGETPEPGYLALERRGRLQDRVEALWRVFSDCQLCGRRCRVNRIEGQRGACRAGAEMEVSSAFAHFGEEKPLVGSHGSGTIFFSRCSLLCCYCQNWEVAHRGDGTPISCTKLARIMVGLQARGCHNINLVTPTHFLPQIVKAVRLAIPMGLRRPLVYNTGGYDNPDVIRLLAGIVDIYLPDFKYQDPVMADRYSSAASDYPAVAAAAVREMHRQVGDLRIDSDGVARRGVMVRHLVLPNGAADTADFARWVAKRLSSRTFVNVMGQYRPEHWAFRYPEIARRVTAEEARRAIRQARAAGLQRVVT